jgi:hypothetical protein
LTLATLLASSSPLNALTQLTRVIREYSLFQAVLRVGQANG